MQKPAIPRLAHLRESGSIEQDADIVMFIYRKAADRNYRLEDLSPEEKHTAEIHIAKHRNGPIGQVNLFFDDSRASFRNLAKKSQTAGMMAPVQAPQVGGGSPAPNFDPLTPIVATQPPNTF
jgi:hypothetical protein